MINWTAPANSVSSGCGDEAPVESLRSSWFKVASSASNADSFLPKGGRRIHSACAESRKKTRKAASDAENKHRAQQG